MPHRHRPLLIAAAILAAASMGAAQPASAQGFLHRIKKAVKEKTKEHVDQHINQAAEAGVSKVDQTIVCVVTDLDCIHKAQAAGTPVSVTDASGKKVSTADSAAALQAASASAPATAAAKPGTGAWVNYDFVPGDTPIFVDDFSADNVGDFPRRLTFTKGNMEVAQWNGARWLRTTSDRSEFAIPLPDTLPQRFTLEFDYAGGDATASDFLQVHFSNGTEYLLFSPPGNDPPSAGIYDDQKGTVAVTQVSAPPDPGTVRHARIMVDGHYAKVYVGSQRVSNVPNATLGRSKAISFKFFVVNPQKPGFVGNIRVAAGGKDLYSTLSTKGRVATHGIFFDVGSATIRPESTPTLKEIGQMLTQHADLKLSIEGHTDNTGSAATNQKLSDERAAAVKTYLVTTYHVDASRLAAKGYGDTKPVASNSTPEGRQQNRRVELVKM
ncbi:MAG TPA: OmpA family protein [Gemmatimonadaceae bacterium]|nr:OmpA family protein [Gemmatimonadaceae bacterium]